LANGTSDQSGYGAICLENLLGDPSGSSYLQDCGFFEEKRARGLLRYANQL